MPRYLVETQAIFVMTFAVEADKPSDITVELLEKEGESWDEADYSHIHKIVEIEEDDDE